jgi:hypothetical protein
MVYASQSRATDATVARAEFVGLQAVQNAQHFIGVATHVQVVHADVLNGVVRVDDEGGAQGHTGGLVADAELVDQGTGHVGKTPVAKFAQVFVVTAPAEFAELVVGGASLSKPTISVGHTKVKSLGQK